MTNISVKFTASILLFIALSLFGNTAFAEYEIQSNKVKMLPVDNKIKNREFITNKPIELYGTVDEKEFYYEVNSKILAKENEVVFHLKHSELLIEPSAVTISIDDERVHSIPLAKDSLTNKVVIPLTGKALSKGFHTIKVAFNGVIKEGVCVDQETPGNWLTIGIDSYLQLQGQSAKEPSLSDYPTIFSAKERETVSVILPEEASMETRSAGASIAAYLGSKSQNTTSLKLVRESNMDAFTTNFVLVGGQSEFQSIHVKDLLSKSNVKVPEKGISVSRHQLNKHVESLFILAETPKEIKQRVQIFLDDANSKQLTGQQMIITSTPATQIDGDDGVISLKKFGMSDLIFDRSTSESDTYFGYAPLNWRASPTLELQLRRSDTLNPGDSEEEMELLSDEVEMIVYINDVPYPINIRNLAGENKGVFSVQIPIEENTISKNHLIAIRFEVTGLRKKNPCFSTNENRWVFLSEDSNFIFQEGDSIKDRSLSSYPYPFSDPSQKTKIILPEGQEVKDDDLMQLVSSLTSFGKVATFDLVQGARFNDSDAEGSQLIFLGGIEVQPALKKIEKELLIPYKEGIPDFQTFGFLQESVQNYSMIQENPWSQKHHKMLILDNVKDAAKVIDHRFLESLSNLNEESTVAIQTKELHLFTNANEIEAKKGKLKSAQTSSSELSVVNMKWWGAGMLGIVVLTFILYRVMKRRKRMRL